MSAKQQKFEDAMKRLEEIVLEMEKSDIDLDKSLAHFEEGIKLVRFCSSKLEETKKKIEILVARGTRMVKEPFESEKREQPEESTNSDTDEMPEK